MCQYCVFVGRTHTVLNTCILRFNNRKIIGLSIRIEDPVGFDQGNPGSESGRQENTGFGLINRCNIYVNNTVVDHTF